MSAIAPPVGTELLDDLTSDADLVRTSLANIARSNRLFGGVAAARYGLETLLAGSRPQTLGLLDVGAGRGDIARALVRWAGRRGTLIRPLGIERHPVAARLAAANHLPTALATGENLPLRSRSVDVVLVSQVAHHLTESQVGNLARECTRVSRLGVIFADLRPSRLSALAFSVACHLLRFDRLTRIDGVTSLARGFTVERLTRILADNGVTARVSKRPLARIVAVWRPAA
ncbi:MAG: methyltransferase domain-containing protein [Gemmatimonadota bacterium]